MLFKLNENDKLEMIKNYKKGFLSSSIIEQDTRQIHKLITNIDKNLIKNNEKLDLEIRNQICYLKNIIDDDYIDNIVNKAKSSII